MCIIVLHKKKLSIYKYIFLTFHKKKKYINIMLIYINQWIKGIKDAFSLYPMWLILKNSSEVRKR